MGTTEYTEHTELGMALEIRHAATDSASVYSVYSVVGKSPFKHHIT
jgi:hypothetical protein